MTSQRERDLTASVQILKDENEELKKELHWHMKWLWIYVGLAWAMMLWDFGAWIASKF